MKNFNEKYTVRDFIDKNKWSNVYECINNETNEKIILNIITSLDKSEEHMSYFKEEINTLMSMNNSNLIMITKGATDIILSRLANIEDKGIVRQINAEDKREIEKKNIEFSQKGMRVLAVAYKNYKSYDLTIDDEDNLTFLGLAAMVDPPREQSESAVQECVRKRA